MYCRRLRQGRTELKEKNAFIQNCIYYLEEKHKDRIASKPKLFLMKFAASAKGIFKLRPREESQKITEKYEDKLADEVIVRVF